jgi:hypothetical protein
MSFGFSITDIVHAAAIAKQIKDIWFTRHNRAGRQPSTQKAMYERLLMPLQTPTTSSLAAM